MADDPYAPDFRRGFLRVPLAFWLGAYCRSPLTRRELQVLSAVLRESWGWGGKDGRPLLWSRPLPTRRIALLTGLSTDRLKRDVDDLAGRGVLLRRGDRYRIVPDPSAWVRRTPDPRPEPPTYPQDRSDAAPERRQSPPNLQDLAAGTAPPSGSDRKRKEIRKKRLGGGGELSTAPSKAGPVEAGGEGAAPVLPGV